MFVVMARRGVGVAFFGAGVLHLALDFGLHHDDGRMHFWPFTDWIFESPISYWDSAAFGHIVGPIEGSVCLVLLVVLWLRHSGIPAKALLVLAGLLELVPIVLFPFLFAGS